MKSEDILENECCCSTVCIMGLGIAVQLKTVKTEKPKKLKIDESRHDLAFSFLLRFFLFS